MAAKIKFTPTYTSEIQAIYDLARSSSLFKQSDYEYFKNSPYGTSDYLYEIAGSKKLDISKLDMSMYEGLSNPEDRLLYITNELYLNRETKVKDDDGIEYNAYDRTNQYLTEKLKFENEQRFYNNLSDIEKTFHTTVGVVGNAINSLANLILTGLPKAGAAIKYGITSGLGMLENPLSDIFEKELTGEGFGTSIVGALGNLTNNFWSEERQNLLQEYSRKYTLIDKNSIVKGVNDIVQGIIQMAPLALNMVAPGAGTVVYYTGMTGVKADEIFDASKDSSGLERLGQLGYLAASTGLEIATEKLSARIFGSNTMDKIFGFGGKTAGIGLGSNLVKSFISEGAEEGFTELVDAMLYKALVDGDADFASLESIFYAALIGGLTGGVMELGGFVFTPRSTILQSGRIVKTNDIKTGKEQILNSVKRLNLSKYASYQLKNALSQITTDEAGNIRVNVGYSNVEKLIYNNETSTDVAVDKNSQEYKDAVEADKNAVLESTVALTKLMEVIGIENFAKSVGLLEKLAKDKESLVEHVVKSNMPNKNSEYQAIQLDYELRNPNEQIEIVAPKNKIESDLAKKVENSFGGIKVYFANTLPGTKGITYNGNYVIIKSGMIENERYDVTKKTVVEELIHTMQRDVLGKLSPKMMDQLDKLMKIKSGTYSNLDLGEAYAGVSKKVKRSEQQAKYLMELLLFDEITIQNVVSLNNGLFEKIYDKLKNMATYMFKGSEKGKAQFQLINRIMANYRKQIAKVALNKRDIDNVKIKASENEINHMKEMVEENPVYKHFTWLNFEHTSEQVGMKRTEEDLRLELNTKYRDKKNKDINYSDITQYQIEQADGSYKDTPFVTKILNIKTVKNFETKNDKFRYNLNQYLLKNTKGNGSFIINPFSGQILQVTDYFDHLNSNIKLNMSRKEFFDKVKTVKDLFDNKFISKFPNELNVEIRIFDDSDGEQPPAFYHLDYNNPRNNYIGINSNYANSYDKVDLEFITTIFHETTHHLSFIQKFHDGSSSELFRTAILEFSEKDESGIINKLLKQVSTEEHYSELILKDNINQIAYELSDYMYLLTGGELNAALGSYNDEILTMRKSLGMGVTENQAKMAGFGKISGFVIEDNMIKGYGKFNYVRIPLSSKKIEKLSKVSESEYNKLSEEQQKKLVIPYNIYTAMKRETFDISFSKTKEINNTMKDIAGDNTKQNLLDYGFSEEFVEEYLTNRNGLPENFFLDMIDRDNVTVKRDPNNERQLIRVNLIGTNDAVDKIIEIYDNKNIKSLKDLREFINTVPSYKVLYDLKTDNFKINNKSLDFDLNKKYSKTEINDLINKYSLESSRFSNYLSKEIEKYTNIMFNERNATLQSYILTNDLGFDKMSFLKFNKAVTSGLLPRQVESIRDEQTISGKEGESELKLSDKAMVERDEIAESALTQLEEQEKTKEELNKESTERKILAAKKIIKNTLVKNQNKLSDDATKEQINEAKEKDIKASLKLYSQLTKQYNAIKNKTETDTYIYESIIKEFPNEVKSKIENYRGTNTEITLGLKERVKETVIEETSKPIDDEKIIQEPEIEKIVEKPIKTETTRAEEVTYKFTKAQDAVLNTTYENTAMSEVQKVGEANQMQQVVRVQEHLEKNKDYYEKLDDAEANAMFDAWDINNDSMNRRSNMLLFAMFIKKNPQRFNEDTMKRADDFLRKTLSMSGRELGLWSQIFERANPIEAALNAFKERFNKDLDGITKKDIEEYNQAFKEGDYNKMSEIELKVLIAAKAQAPKESVNFISKGTILERYEKFKRFVKKMNGFRYMAMLTNPATHLRNIASNIMMWIGEKIDNSLTKVFQNIIKFEKGQLKYISNQEIKPETIKYVKEKLEDSGLLAYVLSGGKYDIVEDGSLKSKINSKLLFNSAFMRKISDIIYDSLEGMDVKFVMPSVIRNLENLIDANGYDVNKMASADFEMLFENALYRSKMTYLKNETQFSKWWRDTIRKNPMLEMTFGAFLPFPKMAYNITMQIMQHSPLGLAMAFKDIIKAKADPSIIAQNPFFKANIANLLAKGTQGTALMLLGLILSALKIINFDEDDQYNGMVLRLGNLKFRLSDLAPSISPMLIAAAMSSGAKNEKDWFERVTSVIEDQTIMGTFDKLFGYGKNIWNLPITVLETYALQYVPSIVKSATKILDNNYKSQKNIFDKLAANLPLISYAVPNKVNPYTGEPLQRYSTPIIAFLNMFSPIAMSTVNKTSIQIEAERLDVTTTGTNGNFKINGEDYKLSGRELETFATNRAKYVEKLFSDFYNNKSKRKVLIENPDGKSTFEYLYYKDMSDDQRANVIESLYTKASELAKINYWTSNGHYFITTSYDELQELQKLKLDNLRYIPNYSKSKYIKK